MILLSTPLFSHWSIPLSIRKHFLPEEIWESIWLTSRERSVNRFQKQILRAWRKTIDSKFVGTQLRFCLRGNATPPHTCSSDPCGVDRYVQAQQRLNCCKYVPHISFADNFIHDFFSGLGDSLFFADKSLADRLIWKTSRLPFSGQKKLIYWLAISELGKK